MVLEIVVYHAFKGYFWGACPGFKKGDNYLQVCRGPWIFHVWDFDLLVTSLTLLVQLQI